MKRKEHTLWIEKYRSNKPEEYIGNEELMADIQKWIAENDVPHLLLSGTAGTGKTTLAKMIVNNIDCDYIYVNASDENGIDTIREKIKGFASTATFKSLKVIILDEADFLTQPAQAALRPMIEEFAMTTRFILTCNYINKIIEPLRSRCDGYVIVPPSKMEVLKHVSVILDKESIKHDKKDLVPLVERFYPDVRSMVKHAQRCSKTGEFIFEELDTTFQDNLIELLKKPTKSTWLAIRQLIIDEQLDDYQPVYQALFDQIEEYGNGNEAELTIVIDEYMWRAGVVPDKEINISAATAKIIEILTRKKQLNG